jgi:hypothetical protein
MSDPEPADRSPYRGHRFPPNIIAHAVWLYFRFHLSFRDVQDLLAERGIVVSHETIRQWCTKFGATYAAGLRRRRVRAGDNWHLDEVVLKINGRRRVTSYAPAVKRRQEPPGVKPLSMALRHSRGVQFSCRERLRCTPTPTIRRLTARRSRCAPMSRLPSTPSSRRAFKASRTTMRSRFPCSMLVCIA